jgi:hypothetical protein
VYFWRYLHCTQSVSFISYEVKLTHYCYLLLFTIFIYFISSAIFNFGWNISTMSVKSKIMMWENLSRTAVKVSDFLSLSLSLTLYYCEWNISIKREWILFLSQLTTHADFHWSNWQFFSLSEFIYASLYHRECVKCFIIFYEKINWNILS